MLRPTKILVPTDFSEYSNKALRQAFDIAKQYKAKVYVLHVVDGGSYYDDLEKQMIEGARKKLQEEIDKFPQTKELEVFTQVVSGNTSEAILTEERRKGIDLIVIASLGQSGIAKYLIGSVARNVLKEAKCPVLLTK
jgi:nucleotide-binding universal stress UspA family protein